MSNSRISNQDFLRALESGAVRAAVKKEDWIINREIKEGILRVFKESPIIDMGSLDQPHYRGYVDKEDLPVRMFKPEDGVRIVPGGSAVRTGAYIGRRVVIMPPSYVNVGAYIDDDTMIDHHVLIGSCAQIGKKVHISASVQICGVLEPIGDRPVIIEDNCFIGVGAIIAEGMLIRESAVIAPNVVLSKAVPIYDVVHQMIYRGEVPSNAVVIAGTRAFSNGVWAKDHGLSLNCAIIVKYRDPKTELSVELESALR